MRMVAPGNLIGRLLYPPNAVCIACGALRTDDPRGLCRACADAFLPLTPPFCPQCGRSGWSMVCPDCDPASPGPLDRRVSAYAYQETARLLVRALKYTHVATAAEALSGGMLAVFPQEPIDALVPIPLHPLRERRRGFNQACFLCVPLSRETGIPQLNALSRTRDTRTQTRLGRQERIDNVSGAFISSLPVRGLSLLLVDDVLTTGATAVACAETLRQAGAKHVSLLTAARAIY